MKGTVTVLATSSAGSSTSGASGSNSAAPPNGSGATPEATQPRSGSASQASSTKGTPTLPNTGANLLTQAAAGLALLMLGIALLHRATRGKPGDENP